jgi:hypothetical protein
MIPQDKAMHFTVGFAISLLISTLSAGFNLFEQPTLGWICLGISALAGLVKECYDYFYQKERFDVWDWVVTALGGVLYFFA